MTTSNAAAIGTSRWRRPAIGRVLVCFLYVLMDLVFVAFAVIGWRHARLSMVVDLVILGASAAVGVLVLLVVASANVSALRSARAGRPLAPARRRATVGLLLALLRAPALALAIYLVVVNTTEGPDGSWKRSVGLLALAFVDILFALFIAVTTRAALGRTAAMA